ncbi:ABC oligo/dipeptide transport, ATP-binding protein [Tenacibaculum maritimum]|uniref:AAA family ATPase n=1 Tax=Tenacibaculum maritimum TaxID=107401 RepID=UPI0012E43220|nr:AAA family ATPase [Tenacibaculum maritimum]CAA0180548.1 ABC oligo/dipeptide transport, ATP-binding protein [Tenacibaculum maritimum]
MKIKSIEIKKFRGFEDVQFDMGERLTVISGQNGTQKTTILGMLSQPFSITGEDNPMIDEKPLSGGSYKSAYSDKFKLSEEFDNAGEHEWTLFFNDVNTPSYTVESIHREKSKGTIRFWKKGSKSKGSGYIQFPVIYLSLKRLFPLSEDKGLRENQSISLTVEELDFFKKWHSKILILTREDDQIKSSNFLTSTNKQTIGINTSYYDWKSNSAGQDNLSKILLSILSFRRLQKKYKNDYKGGILAIDEIAATFYPGSQIRLLEFLSKFASQLNLQIIFTTHSLTILKEVAQLRENPNRKNQVKLMFLVKKDNKVKIRNNVDYLFIKNHLNKTITGSNLVSKIDTYTEDKEGAIFVKSLLGTKRTKNLNFINIPLGCGNLIQLSTSKVPSFQFPNSIIILDGDVKLEKKQYNKTKRLKNVLLLPTEKSPEQLISSYLYSKSDNDPLWETIDKTFDHQYCFLKYSNDEIQNDRVVAKKWFNSHLELWGRNASKVLNFWKKENKVLVDEFIEKYDAFYKKIINR